MKNILLLIIGIIGVATVMFPIFYYPLTDYYTYKAPIKNSIIVPKFTHVDTVFHSDINYKSEHPLFDISIIDDDTIKVSFRNHGNIPEYGIRDFEDFERKINVGDMFVVHCQEDRSYSYLTIYQFDGIKKFNKGIFVYLIHGGAESKVLIPCDYPHIVDYSINAFDLRDSIYVDKRLSRVADLLDRVGYDKSVIEVFNDVRIIDEVLEICEKPISSRDRDQALFYNGTHHIDTSTCNLQKIEDVCDMTKDVCSVLPPFKKIIRNLLE